MVSRTTDPARTRELAAADRLEELLVDYREVVNLIRSGHPRSYALVYEARRELSRVVAKLGVGVPTPSRYDWGVHE